MGFSWKSVTTYKKSVYFRRWEYELEVYFESEIIELKGKFDTLNKSNSVQSCVEVKLREVKDGLVKIKCEKLYLTLDSKISVKNN